MTRERPRVKICGVKSPAEALLAAELGADLIGLNFHPLSPRFLELDAAREIATAAAQTPRKPLLVGVFVHQEAEEAAAIGNEVGLDLLQFHGNLKPEVIAPVAERSLVALRAHGRPEPEELAPWREIGVWGLILDASHPSLFGGTGKSWDFASVAGLALPGERLLIAGGLNAGNLVGAVEAARPWGVDLCSGVENAPGTRDPGRLRELFRTLDDSFPSA
jgi:phosphoribosylanthranilate isomerase